MTRPMDDHAAIQDEYGSSLRDTQPETANRAGHQLTADGESTAMWACQAQGFFGSIRQLTSCARCGEGLKGGPNTPRRYRDTFKPTAHVICDPCHEELPA